MSDRDAMIATTRFGLGPRPGERAAAATDPRGWLLAQLENPPVVMGPATVDLLREAAAEDDDKPDRAERKARRKEAKAAFRAELITRQRARIASRAPFFERLVGFWSNHFTVSVRQRRITRYACAFEREAIRPFVTGRFADMLRAVAQHPAMLVYLDNQRSIGPDSKSGMKAADKGKARGLNENLAREILELHTLGTDSGYAQADVVALARLLTGWTVMRATDTADALAPHGFHFSARAHEPGEKLLLGVRYAQGGRAEGEAALTDLARHPSTARHVATKLARHFVADDPPAEAVDTLARVFLDTDGDLAALSRALVGLDAAWTSAGQKLRDPEDWLTAVGRAVQLDVLEEESARAARLVERLARALDTLGQVPFSAPSPAGYGDRAADHAGGEALLRRVEVADRFGARLRERLPEGLVLGQALLGDALSARTATALTLAPDRGAALALLFCSPELMRR